MASTRSRAGKVRRVKRACGTGRHPPDWVSDLGREVRKSQDTTSNVESIPTAKSLDAPSDDSALCKDGSETSGTDGTASSAPSLRLVRLPRDFNARLSLDFGDAYSIKD